MLEDKGEVVKGSEEVDKKKNIKATYDGQQSA